MSRVLDGTAIAATIKAEVRADVERLALQGIRPGLAAVLVGHVPASQIYVRSKVKTCEALGLFSELITPPETVTTEQMLELIDQLNARQDIDGILIQLPLPAHVNAKLLLEAVSPDKDVDGFHPVNVGRLQTGQPALPPCTAAGIIEILKRSDFEIAGYRGQTHGDHVAGRECDGDGVPFAHAGSGLVYPARGHSRGGHRQAGIRDHRDGETGRDRCGRRD
jgi:methylenetetrahydrofolate dehydrogenase (NADP+) / methenyltetrahydrofolate cyclohydrolase